MFSNLLKLLALFLIGLSLLACAGRSAPLQLPPSTAPTGSGWQDY